MGEEEKKNDRWECNTFTSVELIVQRIVSTNGSGSHKKVLMISSQSMKKSMLMIQLQLMIVCLVSIFDAVTGVQRGVTDLIKKGQRAKQLVKMRFISAKSLCYAVWQEPHTFLNIDRSKPKYWIYFFNIIFVFLPKITWS